jgi:hypothetical protein
MSVIPKGGFWRARLRARVDANRNAPDKPKKP